MSYSSFSSSSSSSGSSSSSSSSSTGTNASFSSCSTIVAPPPCVRPFGAPEYNYFWIENKSKTNPKLSYFYNYKSHSVVWQRPVSRDVALPFYSTYTAPRESAFSEDEEVPIVSDNENDYCKKIRLEQKKRNRRLVMEELDESIQVLSVKKTIKSRKMLNTLWKLFRYPGETVLEVKKRLIDPVVSNVKIKTEVLSDGDEYIPKDFSNIPIKKEIDNTCTSEIENLNKTLKSLDEDSDSDPEHVDYLIKQEYLDTNVYSDSELEEESKEKEVSEEINKISENEGNYENFDETTESDDDSTESENEIARVKQEKIDFEFEYEAPYLLASLLEIEITEDDKEVTISNDESASINVDEENINWTFEQSYDNPNNSALTHLALNPFYKTSKLSKIEKKRLKMKQKQKKKKAQKKIPKLIIKKEPEYEIQGADENHPIICNMYGVRTINYNHPPKIKVPRWQSCSKLSDSEDDSESEFAISKNPIANGVKDNQNSTITDKKQAPLELKNWFPKQKKRRRRNNSDNSWNESNLSGYSDLDEYSITLVKMKKEKKDSEDIKHNFVTKIKQEKISNSEKETDTEEEFDSQIKIKQEKISNLKEEMDTEEEFDSQENNHYIYKISDDNILLASFKKASPGGRLPTSRLEMMESQMTVSKTPPKPAVDLSIVKAERRSSDMEKNIYPKLEPVENYDDGNCSDSSSSSSSSPCCSKSSCSCSSSSSSSSSDDDTIILNKETVEIKQEIE